MYINTNVLIAMLERGRKQHKKCEKAIQYHYSPIIFYEKNILKYPPPFFYG